MATTDQMATYQSEEGYGKCASWCIGQSGGVAFNWVLYPNGAVTCQCLRNVSDRRIYYKIFSKDYIT